jgi:hypothetical protein
MPLHSMDSSASPTLSTSPLLVCHILAQLHCTHTLLTQFAPLTLFAGGVSPVRLIDLMRSKLEAAGGAVLERTRLQGGLLTWRCASTCRRTANGATSPCTLSSRAGSTGLFGSVQVNIPCTAPAKMILPCMSTGSLVSCIAHNRHDRAP